LKDLIEYDEISHRIVPEEHGDHACFSGFCFTNRPWRQQRPELMASRLLSSVRPHAVHYLPGIDRSRVLMHFWSMPDRQETCIHCAQHASEFSRTLRLWTKYTIHFFFCSCPHRTQSESPHIVARRGETCCHVSSLQPKVQVAICHRPTLARVVCSSELPHLRGRSRRHERPRYGEG
jgi:hypothetical protein